MTQRTVVAAGYIPGAGKLQHEVGLVDGYTAEYSDIAYDSAGNAVPDLSFIINPDFTIELVVTGDADPSGLFLQLRDVRFDVGSYWTDYESFLIPVEAFDDRVEPDPTTTVVYHTAPDGTELVRPI